MNADYDIMFCADDCKVTRCERHKSKAIKFVPAWHPTYYANLKNTEYCVLSLKNNEPQ